MDFQGLPKKFVEACYLSRKRLVENALKEGFDECELLRMAPILSPMIATHGPAGINVAPFMVSFTVKDEYLEEAVKLYRKFLENPGERPLEGALNLLLDTIYDPAKVDLKRLATHLMSRGHTWKNIVATGEAALGYLVPPDKGAYEVRVSARIVERGLLYEYVNLTHDLMHVAPEGERHHPWFPALIMNIKEIYDNSYQLLGKRIYP